MRGPEAVRHGGLQDVCQVAVEEAVRAVGHHDFSGLAVGLGKAAQLGVDGLHDVSVAAGGVAVHTGAH
eukprot:scaffold681969_cov51-Prasinocladus_malaysianus.AAC.1